MDLLELGLAGIPPVEEILSETSNSFEVGAISLLIGFIVLLTVGRWLWRFVSEWEPEWGLY